MAGILSLETEYAERLHPEALKWFSDQRATIQRQVPLEGLSDDDLNTFLSDDEKREFMKYKDEITRGLVRCMDTGDEASPDPMTDAIIGLTVVGFEIESLLPMRSIKSLLKKVYERKAAKEKEDQKRWHEEEKRRHEQAEARWKEKEAARGNS